MWLFWGVMLGLITGNVGLGILIGLLLDLLFKKSKK